MKTELKAKFLQHLTQRKKDDEGFTLIELLVVIIIIGILSAIALPSFLNQAAKARGAEAKSNVGAMNRAQQAYYLEQQNFTTNISQLGLSLKSSDNFSYYAETATTSGVTGIANQGKSKVTDIKSYTGGVFYTPSTSTSEGFTTTILCEAENPGASVAVVAGAININNCDTAKLVK